MARHNELSGKRLGYLEGWASIAVNTILFGVKSWVGVSVGSVAMIADAWHTLSDCLTSVIVILGFWLSGKPADSRHPFGHGRAELIAAVVIGTLLGAVGLHFLFDSIERLSATRGVLFKPFAVYVFAASALVKELLARFAIWAGRKTGSSSIAADGWHHRSDAVTTAVIVGGALLGTTFWWIDGVLGILVSVVILYAAYSVVSENAPRLLGETVHADLEEQICRVVAEAVPEASDCHHFHAHRYGDHLEATLHVRVSPDKTVSEAHEIASAVSSVLKDRFDMEATVHVEPREPGAAEASP
jgi:cation diffusion facilitator family transporter